MRRTLIALLLLSPATLLAQRDTTVDTTGAPPAAEAEEGPVSTYLQGFEARRRRNTGGQFLTSAQIDSLGREQLIDVLRQRIPGAIARQCRPLVFLDGTLQGGVVDRFLSARDVAAVEWYSTGFIPPEFRRGERGGTSVGSGPLANGPGCGALLLWTRT
ncbi:MAG TPA: hypothetical protein VEA99_06630 [Gemmatimonadaceae bacterium]|nr:hypothetical protein [Gemmatimonadaceae bacterium]